VAVIACLVGFLVYLGSGPVYPLDAHVTAFRGDEVLRAVVWPGQAGGAPGVRGPNGRDTDWAIFFYKPYCGACKRVWPAFRALGATTNSSGKLRFGEVDCVRDKSVCTMLKAEKQPVVRIYRATEAAAAGPDGKIKKKAKGFKRDSIAEWSGLLIAYEVVDWFKSLQRGPDKILPADIVWPRPDELGAAMRRFKARGKTQHDSSLTKRPKDPAGYLVDAELALTMGLTDHVFPYAGVDLEGDRLKTMLRWLEVQAFAFPKAAVRTKIKALRARLANRQKWEQKAFENAVRAQGFSTAPVSDDAWRWCETSNGRGGYSCALWVLFHATLSSVARTDAPYALHSIALWVNDFFGCEECARHFIRYYEDNNGHEVEGGQIGAVLWLWRAHNAVTARLRGDEIRADGSSDRRTDGYPEAADCEPCFNSTDGAGAQEHSVFEYLQEVYCFEADTYVCSGFDDPSKDKGNRAVEPPPETDKPKK